MANSFLRKYETADLVLKTRAHNLFVMALWSQAIFYVIALLTFINRTPLVAGAALGVAVTFTAAILILGMGWFKQATIITAVFLDALAVIAVFFNRNSFIEGDLYQAVFIFILLYFVVNTFSSYVWISILVGLTGMASIIGITLIPPDPILIDRTLGEVNLEANTVAIATLYILAAIVATNLLVQQNRLLRRMQGSLATIAIQNETLEEKVQERTIAIKNILDTSGQGFLSFGPDFLVEGEFSKGCVDIFGNDIHRASVVRLLYPHGGEAADEFVQGLKLYFDGKSKAEVIFDLLEPATYINGKYVEIEYRELSNGSIMCILTDVTLAKQLEEKNRREEARQALILRVISNKLYFSAFLEEAEALFTTLESFWRQDPTREQQDEFLRHLHTFKGNAGFFNFTTTQELAHDFEYAISDSLVLGSEVPYQDLYTDLKKAYFGELRVITQTMGQEWVEELGGVVVPRTKFHTILAWVKKHHPEDRTLLRALARHDLVTMRELLMPLTYQAEALAEKLGKRIKPVVFDVEDFKVSPRRFGPLAEACIHLVNNMVDHGIENSWDREAAGKDAAGKLEIRAHTEHGFLQIIFQDDGGGIDSTTLLAKAKERGLVPEQASLDPETLHRILFADGISSRRQVDQTSGRGVGLAAVKAEVERLGGSIEVTTRQGTGTNFVLSFPLGPRPRANESNTNPTRSRS